MSPQRTARVLRVFTRDGVGGNHLGIVTDLNGLSDHAMQEIAAELGFSETIFPDLSVEPPFIRIFTPGMELAFAGHPLVGAAWLLLNEGRASNTVSCGIGDIGIRLDGESAWADAPMTPANAQADDLALANRTGVADATGAWRVAMPLDYRMVELASPAEVAAATPDTTALAPADGLTLFHRDGDRVRMRFFIPVAGVDEDPATGSAAVALATMWAASGESSGRVTIHQGEEMGHPSQIELRWSAATASIGGTVVEDEPRVVAI
jgi:trans-2,3-dihydro-3-hydroxyanthranilate isomerase